MAARAPQEEPRSHSQRALRGFRRGDWRCGLGGDDEPLHCSSSGRVAAQKKSKVAQEREEGARALWRWLASRLDVRRLVFVDESGTHISMDRLRSRAPRGARAYGKVPNNRGKNLTLIASMSLSGMGESMCLEGATDAKAFEAYVEHFLAPSLCEGQVVVMDNLGAHRPKKIRDLIEARGAELVFVPSYSSPDLNPIEQ